MLSALIIQMVLDQVVLDKIGTFLYLRRIGMDGLKSLWSIPRLLA